MYQTIIAEHKSLFDNVLVFLKNELAKIRTGRANAAVLDAVFVNAYGSKMPISQLATVNVPEPRLITVQPWDKSMFSAIETAIREANIGLNPSNDGNVIRLSVPPLTEERRVQVVKMVNQKAEESRIRIRNAREDVWKMIQTAEESGEISEDDKFKGKDALQKMTDEYNRKIEDMRLQKETEVMTI